MCCMVAWSRCCVAGRGAARRGEIFHFSWPRQRARLSVNRKLLLVYDTVGSNPGVGWRPYGQTHIFHAYSANFSVNLVPV